MALAYPTSVTVEVELSGEGGGWTTLSDIAGRPGIKGTYGIQGNTPRDRVATTGTLSFELRNGPGNSAGTLGYYSPDHASKLTGWGVGIGVRLAIVYGGTTYYKWRGTVEDIVPVPGQYRETRVLVTCVDWMDDAAKAMIRNIPTQTDQRTDELLTILVEGTGTLGEWGGVSRQPGATSFSTGKETLEYAFDGAEDETTPVLTEIQKVASSEFGRVFVKGDTTQGGTLTFENRTDRGEKSTNSVALDDDDLREMIARGSRDDALNDITVQVHPRRIDAAATSVLFNLEYVPKIVPGEELEINVIYRDPDQRAVRVGGTAMVEPAPSTDYTFNTEADGSGSDRTAYVSVDVAVRTVTIKNFGKDTGHLTKFQIRGKGIYAYETVSSEARDGLSQYRYGLKTFFLDMAYQSSPTIARSASSYLLHQNKNPYTRIDSVAFTANASSALMTQALAREVGDRIGITETLTGATASAQNVTTPTFSPIGSVYIPTATAFETGRFRPWSHPTSDVVYYAHHGPGSAPRLVAVDLSTPAAPSINELTHANLTDPHEGVVIGDYLYLQDGDAGAIHVIDVSTPASPSYDSEFTDAAQLGDPDQIVGAGDWLYVSDDDGGAGSSGVKILDVSTPGSPSYDNTWGPGGSPHNLALSSDGNLLAVGVPIGKRIWLVDVSDPTSPSSLAAIDEDYTDQLNLTHDLAFSGDGNWLYVTTRNAGGSATEQTVSILDVRTPASPTWATQNAAVMIELDTTGDTSAINGITLQPEDETLYIMGGSTDRDPSGGPLRGRGYNLANGVRAFGFATYPRGLLSAQAWKMCRVGAAPATYGAAIVQDSAGAYGLQVFQLRATYSRAVAHYINAVEFQIVDDHYMRVGWLLQPTLSESFWLLDTAGFTELNSTTRLAWGVS